MGETKDNNAPQYDARDPEFQQWLRRNDPEPTQAGAAALAGSALCDNPDTDGGSVRSNGGRLWNRILVRRVQLMYYCFVGRWDGRR